MGVEASRVGTLPFKRNGSNAPPHVVGAADEYGRNASARVPHVLVVEDDPFLSLHMETILFDAGLEPVGMATSVEDGLAAIDADAPDAAVLDVNLRGAYVFPVAERLRERGIPFIFVSAYASDEALFPEHLRDVPRHAKPVDEVRLLETLAQLLDS